MKTPSNYGGFNLATWLAANNQFVMADLYTITLIGGGVLRYTSASEGLVIAGNAYSGSGVIPERGMTRIVIGVEVDTLDVKFYATPSHTIGSTPFLQALKNGALDGAQLQLERYFAPAWGSSQYATIKMFSGEVADMDVGRFSAAVRVNSEVQGLAVKMPRNLYQPGCLNTLYSDACGVSKASFLVTGSVSSVTSASVFATGLSEATGYFDMGIIEFTGGINAGITASVKHYASGVVTLMTPLYATPSPGDTFNILPGCDKKKDTCDSKFSNLPNHRSFPYIPVPESVI